MSPNMLNTKFDSEFFRAIFENAPVGMAIADLKGRFVHANLALCDLLGYSPAEFEGLCFRKIATFTRKNEDARKFHRLMTGKDSRIGLEKSYIRKDGRRIYGMLYISLLCDNVGRPQYFIGQFADITDRKTYEESIKHLAYYDSLTGLPNRVLFKDRLETALVHCRAKGSILAVMFLDLDCFKNINDTSGHSIGDEALKTVADRLKNSVRKTDTVARMGGDEFTLILNELSTERDINAILQKILYVIERPLFFNGQKFVVSASVGVAIYPRDGNSVEELLQAADKLMYNDKRNKGLF